MDTRVEICFSRLDPPEGLAVRVRRRGEDPGGEPQRFVGWLGLLGVLQSLADEQSKRPPP